MNEKQMEQCPCGSGEDYAACCGPLHAGSNQAATAEILMRSRYCAYAKGEYAYLNESLHPDHSTDHDTATTRRWAENSEWLKLEIVAVDGGGEQDDEGKVEFIATYREDRTVHRHHELGEFRRQDGRWYFVDGNLVAPVTQRHDAPKIGRNEPCPCGSVKKYKKCCGG